MDRKDFLKKTLLGSAGVVATTAIAGSSVEKKPSTYDKLMEQVGFNHLPNKENKTMNTILHKADTRGYADHGWLKSHHTFSFANYYNPERVHFGVLRVLNDDYIDAGTGFGKHPHDNMEIISIPLEGDLEHQDSMGNKGVIRHGDIQVMSAGTGIFHSEMNASKTAHTKFLQIWVFPNKKNVEPRYDQITLDESKLKNTLYQIVSPNPEDEGVWIHQNAWFHLGEFDHSQNISYDLKLKGNGVYAFLLEGTAKINGIQLERRDGLGIWDTDQLDLEMSKDSRILLMEVPMEA
ncbi:MAG: pirin family protein [Flavobacteriia bacterium]|nr:pirin family protein [Flavobacteriia bacterium]OJX36085.1 MAG: hypothetical protein BGO87_06370 [Flavobacteriia bacterium 40-80]